MAGPLAGRANHVHKTLAREQAPGMHNHGGCELIRAERGGVPFQAHTASRIVDHPAFCEPSAPMRSLRRSC